MFGLIVIIIMIIFVCSFLKKKNQIENTMSKYRDQIYDNFNKVGQNINYMRRQTPTSNVNKYGNDNPKNDEYTGKESTIGYIKCPKCGTANSKKHDKCFMCDENLK